MKKILKSFENAIQDLEMIIKITDTTNEKGISTVLTYRNSVAHIFNLAANNFLNYLKKFLKVALHVKRSSLKSVFQEFSKLDITTQEDIEVLHALAAHHKQFKVACDQNCIITISNSSPAYYSLIQKIMQKLPPTEDD